MEYRSYYERINNISNIDFISKKICDDYGFKTFLSYQLIEIGYEDFNYILNTTNNKYVVKIFNTDRDDSSCKRLVDILVKSMKNNIPVPKLFKYKNEEYIYEIKIKNTVLKLFVMEYINGKNYWELNKELTKNELKEVAKIASKINLIDYDISETFYDEWTITNLQEEYNKKKQCLNNKDKSLISEILKEFSLINFDEMTHSYIHGDLIKANLLLDSVDNKIYVIDFSAFNYLPRIVEIAASVLDICLTDNKTSTIERINLFLKHYNSYNPLDDNEIENLALILRALSAMYIIQTSYIKSNSGDYVENEYWLSQGRKFLDMNINKYDISID